MENNGSNAKNNLNGTSHFLIMIIPIKLQEPEKRKTKSWKIKSLLMNTGGNGLTVTARMDVPTAVFSGMVVFKVDTVKTGELSLTSWRLMVTVVELVFGLAAYSTASS